jgi:hypothetical protein
MLGVYKKFPKDLQWTGSFSVSVSAKRLQQILFDSFVKLNSETLKLEDIADPSIPDCRVNFEIGIADGDDFCLLDGETKLRLLATLRKRSFERLDFLFVARYRKMSSELGGRMRFDYYILRVLFNEKLVQLDVAHKKGVRHTSPDDIVNLITDKVNRVYTRKILKIIEED